MVLLFSFFQFCEVGGLPIIHKATSPNLVTSKRRKLKSFGTLLHFGTCQNLDLNLVILPKKSKWQLWVFFPKNHLFKPFLLPNYENFPCQKKKLPLHHLVLILCSCKNKLCHDQIYHQLCSLSSLFILLLLLTKLMNSFIYSNYLPWHKI